MTRCQLTVSLLILLLAAISSSAFASGTTATVKVSFTVLPFQSLVIAGDDSGDATVYSRFDLRQPSEANSAVGYIEKKSALTLKAAGNIPWTVNVRALESDAGTSDDETYNKFLADFSLRSDGGSSSSIAGSDQTLAGGDTGEYILVIDYNIDTEKGAHRDGDYGLTVVYTTDI